MKKIGNKLSFVLCMIFISLTVTNSVAAQSYQAALAEVVAAENRFADYASENGTRAAFIEFAASDGFVFGQKPENAKEVWQKRQPNATLLVWRPAWADVSADGTLGYTTGPWAFSRNKTDAPTAWGEYFTIWKKQADGSWRFVLDLGIEHGQANLVAKSWGSPEASGKVKTKNESAEIWKTLEKSFAESIAKKGARKTYEKFSSEQIRLLREKQMPFQGKTAALAQINESTLKMTVLGGGAAENFAYTYGEYEAQTPDQKPDKGFYARVWKRESNGWRIAAEVVHLLPAPKN